MSADDPVSMHLLMETAIGDSQQYEVLSFEEIDDLKKQWNLLSSRIEGTRRKLALENKLRDAALSLNRLHSTKSRESIGGLSGSSPKRHQRSLMGSRGSNSDILSKTDDELATSTRKCEDLSQELWTLERRAQEVQKRLLEHTAGVLQMTHQGLLKKDVPPPSPDAVPDNINEHRLSPYFDGSQDFDDRSFYQTLDTMLELKDGQQNLDSSRSTREFEQQTQTILETERRLEDFNQRLRDSILQVSAQSKQPPVPPVRHDDEKDSTVALQEQLSYLEKGFEVIQEDQNAALQTAKRSVYKTEERLEDLNTQIHGMINRSSDDPHPQYPLPPEMSGQSSEEQILYLEEGLDTLEQSLQRLTDARHALNSRSATHEEKAEQFETVLLGLWDIILSGEEESLKRDLQQNLGGPNKPNGHPPTATFSLPEFSAKVQSLCARVTGLQEQKEILAKQIQQQRELNSKSDAEKDAQVSDLTMKLDQAGKSVFDKDEELDRSKNEMVLLVARLDEAQQEVTRREQEREIRESNALIAEKEARREMEEGLVSELHSKQDEVAQLEEALQELKDDSGIAHAEMVAKLEESNRYAQDLSIQLQTLKEETGNREASEGILKQNFDQKSREAERAQKEMQNLEAEVVRLRTEVTVARAELDGAYGTRAQRAAEVASNPALQKELDALNEKNASLVSEISILSAKYTSVENENAEIAQRMQVLQRELSEMISEYEVMTKSSIEFEKEREQLENSIDSLRDRCESLETELGDEKVRWLGVKSPGSSGAKDVNAPGTTSTMVLKNEFKKMMRETRAENMKALRVRHTLVSLLIWLIENIV